MKTVQRVARPVQINQVALTGGFWKKRQDVNRRITLPIEYEQCKQTGRIDAFALKWKPGMPNQPHHFWDSDLAKWIEAAGYSLATHPDPKLRKAVDQVIDLVCSAQQPDGYLNVFYTVVQPGKRWTNLRDMHELYCAGHLMEAAVAYAQGTGDRKLLDCLCRYADHIASTFGPASGQKRGYCGHPEVELALMRLYRQTGQKRYLDIARFFVTERGRSPHYFGIEAKARGEEAINHLGQKLEYFMADKPLTRQKNIEGHAVRALYLLSGAIDVAAETHDAALWQTCQRLFASATRRRMYVTGGVGSMRHNERFTADYDLPNETAYAETCAAIALVMAAHRMLMVQPDRQYGDVMERALYNGVMSGVSLKGDSFFYANPLEVDYDALTTEAEHLSARRKKWFGCSCCPPNVARILASLNQYIYATSDDTLYVHLYAASTAQLTLGGTDVKMIQNTDYPWDGRVSFRLGLTGPSRFKLALRIPGWCNGATVRVDGKAVKPRLVGGYAVIDRTWSDGDTVELILPMEIQLIETTPRCRNNIGRVAVQRGPIVYCAEEIDNGPNLAAYVISRKAKLVARFEPRMLGGVTVLSGQVMKRADANWDDQLYRPLGRTMLVPARLKLVPYCVWSNRKVGRMLVWLPVV